MLLGQVTSQIGVKNRTALPKRFREVLGSKVIITKGFEQSLLVIAEKDWKGVLESIEKSSVTQESARETKRFLLGGVAFVDLDEKGRFILPQYLKEFAKLNEEIVFVGQDTYVEIWDKTWWNKYSEELIDKISVVAEKLTVQKEAGNE